MRRRLDLPVQRGGLCFEPFGRHVRFAASGWRAAAFLAEAVQVGVGAFADLYRQRALAHRARQQAAVVPVCRKAVMPTTVGSPS